MNLGKKLKYLRLKKGLTQKDVALRLRVSQKTLSNIENNNCDIKLLLFIELGRIMEFDLCEFLTDPTFYKKKASNREESVYVKNVILKKEILHYKAILRNKNEINRLLKDKIKAINEAKK